jgi:exodeoxyribonuclease-1
LNLEQGLKHAEWARDRSASMDGIWAEVYARRERDAREAGPVDVDQDLYGGFVGNDDRRSLQRLRGLSGEQLADKSPGFVDERLDELLFRYRARNFPGSLNEAEQARWLALRSARLHEGEGGGLTLQAFFDRIDQLSEGLSEDDERGQEILGALYEYAEQIAP